MTSTRPVYGQDLAVIAWVIRAMGCLPFHVDLAVGVSRGNDMVGAFAFSGYNGSDAEVHFFGPGVLKRHIVREIFVVATEVLRLNRLTVRTRKDSMSRGVVKLGAVHEGTMKRVYGPSDDTKHAAECYVFFRERMEILARR